MGQKQRQQQQQEEEHVGCGVAVARVEDGGLGGGLALAHHLI
jgi:hypothetical protein